jgi:hypothetical protein
MIKQTLLLTLILAVAVFIGFPLSQASATCPPNTQNSCTQYNGQQFCGCCPDGSGGQGAQYFACQDIGGSRVCECQLPGNTPTNTGINQSCPTNQTPVVGPAPNYTVTCMAPCPTGQTYQSINGVMTCQTTSPVPANAPYIGTCPPGQSWDQSQNQCVQTSGSPLNNTQCQFGYTYYATAGCQFVNGAITNPPSYNGVTAGTSPVCNAGFYSHYSTITGSYFCDITPTCSPIDNVPQVASYVDMNEGWICVPSPICPSGQSQTFVSSTQGYTCTATPSNPSCSPGYQPYYDQTNNAIDCVPNPGGCISGQSLVWSGSIVTGYVCQ